MITKEFLEKEIEHLKKEGQKAANFVVQAEGIISAYTMLISKFEESVGTPSSPVEVIKD